MGGGADDGVHRSASLPDPNGRTNCLESNRTEGARRGTGKSKQSLLRRQMESMCDADASITVAEHLFGCWHAVSSRASDTED
jgi:hypothetical protein